MAKQDQQVLMSHKGQLERELARARITDFKDATAEQVSVGSIVEVRIPDGGTTRYTILGVWDGDPEHHVISYKTPLGSALIGKKAGETVKVKTGAAEESYSIVSIARYA
jgi:transcription elongation GreA/GreB family factor